MSTGVIRISAALFALALLLGVAGLYAKPTQATSSVAVGSVWASVPQARTGADITTVPRGDEEGAPADFGFMNGPIVPGTGTDPAARPLPARDDGDVPATVEGAMTDSSSGVTTLTVAGTRGYDALTYPEIVGSEADPPGAGAIREVPSVLLNAKVGDWVEVLTGPGAGKAGQITDVEKFEGKNEVRQEDSPADLEPPAAVTVATGLDPYVIITLDPAEGLMLMAGIVTDPTSDLAPGVIYRIVEQNPTRTVELEVSDTNAPTNDEGNDSPYFKITVDSDGADQPMPYEFEWNSGTDLGGGTGAEEPLTVKFELAASSNFGARVIGGVAARNEPTDYWVGHSITAVPTNAPEGSTERVRYLITTYTEGETPTTTPSAAGDGQRIEVIQVPAFEDQDVTFRYGLSRRTVTTDKIGPIISNVSPAKAAVVQEGRIIFEADVIDVSSGYSDDSDDMRDSPSGDGMEADPGQGVPQSGWVALEIDGAVVNGDDPGMAWTKIGDGWRMTYTNDLGRPGFTDPIPWRIIARDRAGAQNIQDHTGSNELTIDGEDPKLVPNRQVKIGDKIENLWTRTGDNWKAADAAGERWRAGLKKKNDDGTTNNDNTFSLKDGVKTYTLPKKQAENRKGILVAFDEEGGLDVSSVDASDFSVDGNTPVSVTVVDVFEENKGNPSAKKRKPQEVFLLMGSNVASDGRDADGDRLEVALTGTVRDVAGNSANSSDPAAVRDGIPPAITVVVDDPDAFDQDAVTVKITVDETLNGAPTLMVYESSGSGGAVNETTGSATVNNTASQAYEADIEVDDGVTVPRANEAALITIVVTATDVSDNVEAKGKSDWSDASAITFQLDPELNNSMDPAFTVAGNEIFDEEMLNTKDLKSGDEAEIEAVDPLLITIDFSRQCHTNIDGCAEGGEAKEYSGDTHKTVELSGVGVDVDLADGSSAEPEFTISSSDDIKFTISVRNPPVGVYTVSLKATDEAGNVSKSAGTAIADTIESVFTVKAAVPTELALDPGWNLISLPFQPSNPGINSILPATHPASLVMSFDNASGLWVVSRRDAETGMFTGDVMQMVATTAYFVFTTSLEPIKLIRPGLATAAAAPAIPSAIAIKAGWNLIPVLTYQSPLPGSPPGSGGVSADDYLGALRNSQGDAAWLRALLWDTTSQTWTSVAPEETVTRSVDDRNPCTGEKLDPRAVARGEEPCQAKQDNNYDEGPVREKMADDPATADVNESTMETMAFDGDDTVVMERHLPLGSGLWLWSTIDSVIFPTS